MAIRLIAKVARACLRGRGPRSLPHMTFIKLLIMSAQEQTSGQTHLTRVAGIVAVALTAVSGREIRRRCGWLDNRSECF